jgi:hypothetical protein
MPGYSVTGIGTALPASWRQVLENDYDHADFDKKPLNIGFFCDQGRKALVL